MSSIVSKRSDQIPWVLMASLAGAQIIAQEFGLSAWRGGGYGMYSTFHPNKRIMTSKVGENWLILDSKPELWIDYRYPQNSMDRYKRFPISRFADEIRMSLDASHKNTQFGYFTPHFDPSNGFFTFEEHAIKF